MKTFLIAITLTFIPCLLAGSIVNKNLILEKFIDQPKNLFKAYYSLYNKDSEYDINSDIGLNKYKVFKANVKYILEQNKKNGNTALGINQFTDLTLEEFRDKYLMKTDIIKHYQVNLKQRSKIEKHTITNVKEIDWRSYMNPAKDQMTCGSCWAFSSIASIEGNYNINFGTLLSLSEQYLVDCDDKDFGCDGGVPEYTFEWLPSNGVLLSENKAYKNQNGNCSNNDRKAALNIVEGADFCDKDCTEERWLEILSKGPMLVVMDGNQESFKNYRPFSENEPWIPEFECFENNHAVTAVGVKLIDGAPHAIVRNSWGADWGYEGNFYVPFSNNCLILSTAYRAKVKENTESLPPLPTAKVYTSCDSNNQGIEVSEGVPDFVTKFRSTIVGFKEGPSVPYLYLYPDTFCRGIPRWVYPSTNSDNRCFSKSKTPFEFKSLQITTMDGNGCSWFYDQTCQSGNWIKICDSIPSISKAGVDLTKTLSIRIGGSGLSSGCITNLVFFEKENYQGKSYGITFQKYGYANLDNHPDLLLLLKKTKSILVSKRK